MVNKIKTGGGRVIQAQNTTVDVVSGATVSSKAYIKSIENALTKK